MVTAGSAKPGHAENPDDLPYVKVRRHTDDPHAEHYDWEKRRWVKDHDYRGRIDEETKYVHMSRVEFFRTIEEMVKRRLDDFVDKNGAK